MFKVYATRLCLYCERDPEVLLETNKLPFEKIYIDEDEKSKEVYHRTRIIKLFHRYGHDDKYVGGYTELVSYVSSLKVNTSSLV